jgi:hypothetical protein
LRFWIVTLGSVFLGAVGIGLEIAAAISKDNGGVSPSLFDSWPCADPIYFARLPRPPEKCIFLRVGSVLNCERLTPAIRASLMIRTIPVVLSRSALCSACAHGQRFRRGYSNVECTQNPTFQSASCLTICNPQPYLLLSKGNASAAETLLINYVS